MSGSIGQKENLLDCWHTLPDYSQSNNIRIQIRNISTYINLVILHSWKYFDFNTSYVIFRESGLRIKTHGSMGY